MKHLKKFLEKITVGDFVKDETIMIIDIFDPERDGYVEYIGYGVDDEKFYFLDPDLDVIGRYDSLEELENSNGIG
jgi:hypothetical protein